MALIFETKVALFNALKTAVPSGVQCTFAEKGDSSQRRQVWLGASTDDDLQPVAMRDGTRKPTSVTGYVEVLAIVVSPGDPINAERSVYELRDSVADACAALDRTTVTGLLDVRPESATVETSETTDGAFSALTVRVKVRGRVTI